MTLVWENGLDLAEIVRCQFGKRYDGSEARNNMLLEAYGDDITAMLQQARPAQQEPGDLFDDGEPF